MLYYRWLSIGVGRIGVGVDISRRGSDWNDDIVVRTFSLLHVSRWRRFSRCFVDTARPNAEALKLAPEWLRSLVSITVEVAATNTHKLPSGSFQVTLASHVLFIALSAMPLIAVALDSKAPLHSFDDEVDAVAMICRVADAYLRAYKKPPSV